MYKSTNGTLTTTCSKDKGTLFGRDNICGALLCWVRGTYPVKQSKATLQKAEEKQAKPTVLCQVILPYVSFFPWVK